MKKFIPLFFASALFIVASLTAAQQVATSSLAPISIGVIFPLTGPAEVWAEYGRMGLELARDEVNTNGGIHGRPLQLIFEDSRTQASHAVNAYKKLTSINEVPVIIGDLWNSVTIPLIPLAERDHVVLISPTVSQDSVQRTSDYFFAISESVTGIKDSVALFFKKNPSIKTLGIFCFDDTWGLSYLKAWDEVARLNNITIVSQECILDYNSDFRSEVTKMAVKKPDAVIVSSVGSVILTRMKEQGFSPKVLATSDIIEEIKVKHAPQELFEGVYLTDWKANKEFSDSFIKKFGKEPLIQAHNSYEALRSVAIALTKNQNDIVKSMRMVKYQGVAGEIDFTKTPYQNHTPSKLYQVQKGEIVEVNDR